MSEPQGVSKNPDNVLNVFKQVAESLDVKLTATVSNKEISVSGRKYIYIQGQDLQADLPCSNAGKKLTFDEVTQLFYRYVAQEKDPQKIREATQAFEKIRDKFVEKNANSRMETVRRQFNELISMFSKDSVNPMTKKEKTEELSRNFIKMANLKAGITPTDRKPDISIGDAQKRENKRSADAVEQRRVKESVEQGVRVLKVLLEDSKYQGKVYFSEDRIFPNIFAEQRKAGEIEVRISEEGKLEVWKRLPNGNGNREIEGDQYTREQINLSSDREIEPQLKDAIDRAMDSMHAFKMMDSKHVFTKSEELQQHLVKPNGPTWGILEESKEGVPKRTYFTVFPTGMDRATGYINREFIIKRELKETDLNGEVQSLMTPEGQLALLKENRGYASSLSEAAKLMKSNYERGVEPSYCIYQTSSQPDQYEILCTAEKGGKLNGFIQTVNMDENIPDQIAGLIRKVTNNKVYPAIGILAKPRSEDQYNQGIPD